MNFTKTYLTIILLFSAAAINAKDVVVVDLMQVGSKAKTFLAKQETIKKSLDPDVKKLEKADADFKKKVQDFQSKASTMSEKKQQEEQQTLMALQQSLQQQQQALQAKIQKIMGEAEKELVEQVKVICKKLGFKIALPGALYVDDAYDKTAEVIAELDKTAPKKTKSKL
jgi:Skp family chaperone for outer membrane proteins